MTAVTRRPQNQAPILGQNPREHTNSLRLTYPSPGNSLASGNYLALGFQFLGWIRT